MWHVFGAAQKCTNVNMFMLLLWRVSRRQNTKWRRTGPMHCMRWDDPLHRCDDIAIGLYACREFNAIIKVSLKMTILKQPKLTIIIKFKFCPWKILSSCSILFFQLPIQQKQYIVTGLSVIAGTTCTKYSSLWPYWPIQRRSSDNSSSQ